MAWKVFAVPILIGLVGCQTIKYSTQQQPDIPRAVPGSAVTRTITTGDYSHFLLWGLIPISPTNVNKELQSKLQPGESLGAVHITESNNFVCGLGAMFTYGLYRPRHVEIQADVHGGSR